MYESWVFIGNSNKIIVNRICLKYIKVQSIQTATLDKYRSLLTTLSVKTVYLLVLFFDNRKHLLLR